MLPALAGLVVGLAYAAISVYWAVGGRWLLTTVGISLSQPGQAGHLAALLELFGRGRGADENELVAAGRLERSGVALDHIGADGGAGRDLLGDVAEPVVEVQDVVIRLGAGGGPK